VRVALEEEGVVVDLHALLREGRLHVAEREVREAMDVAALAIVVDAGVGLRAAWYAFFGCIYPTYFICLHARFGQTIGKRLRRIKVTDVDGGPITWAQAFKRELINLPFAAWQLLVVVVVVLRGGDAHDPQALELGPPAGYGLWLLALELLSARSSPKRQALHDKLADTVVVRTRLGHEVHAEPAA